jgi:putative transposase
MHKYQNKYRIPSARLPHWDYGSNGAYFITICTAQRTHFFGTVANGTMQLNALGTLAQQYWQEIPQHFPYIQLANFVVMPNHTHGILIIEKSVQTQFIASPNAPNAPDTPPVETQLIASLRGAATDATDAAGTAADTVDGASAKTTDGATTATAATTDAPPPKTGGFAGQKNPLLNDNIPRVIRWYKGRCAFEMRKINPAFAWQSRYHDHIIRDEQSFHTIQHYIANNPLNWEKDTFYAQTI